MDRPVSGVVCAVMDRDRILLINRNKEPFSGLWALPGGKIEHGEHVDQASVREIMEESGLETGFDSFRGVVSEHIVEGGKVDKHFILFVCNLLFRGGDLKESREGELKWLSLDELERERGNIVPSDYYMIKEMVRKDASGHFVSIIRKCGDGYSQERFERL